VFTAVVRITGAGRLADFPELRVEARWVRSGDKDVVHGRAVIEAGKLVERQIEKKDA